MGDPGALRAPWRQRRAAAPAGGRRARGSVALGLLGDLVGHDARELHARTGLVPERGALGVWLVGEAGALLVTPGGRRVFCWCVQVAEPGLPSGDRIAHLLLALRADEEGFATVANLAFSGAPWRLRRRLAAARAARARRRGPYGPRVEPLDVKMGSTVHVQSGDRDRSCSPCPPLAPAASSSYPPPPLRASARPRRGVRRFRLAQLRLEARDVPRSQRFTHLKRAYD